jgi:hypothetical protein
MLENTLSGEFFLGIEMGQRRDEALALAREDAIARRLRAGSSRPRARDVPAWIVSRLRHTGADQCRVARAVGEVGFDSPWVAADHPPFAR